MSRAPSTPPPVKVQTRVMVSGGSGLPIGSEDTQLVPAEVGSGETPIAPAEPARESTRIVPTEDAISRPDADEADKTPGLADTVAMPAAPASDEREGTEETSTERAAAGTQEDDPDGATSQRSTADGAADSTAPSGRGRWLHWIPLLLIATAVGYVAGGLVRPDEPRSSGPAARPRRLEGPGPWVHGPWRIELKGNETQRFGAGHRMLVRLEVRHHKRPRPGVGSMFSLLRRGKLNPARFWTQSDNNMTLLVFSGKSPTDSRPVGLRFDPPDSLPLVVPLP